MSGTKLKKVGCARCPKWNEVELDILRTIVAMFQEQRVEEGEKLEKLWLPLPILQLSCKSYTNDLCCMVTYHHFAKRQSIYTSWSEMEIR